MMADATRARGVCGQCAGLLDSPEIGGIETRDGSVLRDLRLMKRAIVIGLHRPAAGSPGIRFEGLVNTCSIPQL